MGGSTLPDRELREYLDRVRSECLLELKEAVLAHERAVRERENALGNVDELESSDDGEGANTDTSFSHGI